ncbi:reverse transcriptase domain-containing protein [Burkholderia plantarii]|uniref:reverse transcriptase domain-containing protein n=1 Tax=Burkholderia plantarii TaxID=41899 RepID=UPI0018DC3501|nr:reverse transcriptase domain-containing protein [Burkholderia plantarii]MBI0326969.1 trypsin-like peptidase domain-containing protein [Burkholderia plantarii]
MVAIPSADALFESLARNNVNWFSHHILGISYAHLKRMIYPRPPYKHFSITKRNGSPRVISEPRRRLKVVQERVLAFLEARRGPLKPAVHGFVSKRSIVTNARAHCSPKNHHILNLDLQDFFPSITFYRVRGVLRKHPFNFSHHVATVIAHICTLDGTLPQGAPTSPLLSNLVCRSMDRDLTDLARRNLARYTRYADDITFSFPVKKTSRLPAAICVVDDDGGVTIGAELHDLIATKHHFTINAAKTRLSDRFRRMEVTGLTINKFPNVRRIFIDRIRGALNAWERNDYAAAEKGWQDRVQKASAGAYEKKPWKRQTRGSAVPKLKNVLWGKLLYLRMVRGKDDLIYTRLAERYNAAVDKEMAAGPFAAPKLPVEPVVRDHDTAEEAVFVLEWFGDYQSQPGHTDDMVMAQGTAFVYGELNLLVTCSHVFEAEAKVGKMMVPTDFQAVEMANKTLQLVRPGTQQAWPAHILYRNKQMDFALVAFDDPVPQHRYFSVMDNPIQARADGILIGFPAYQNWNLPDFNDQKVLNRTIPNAGMNSFTIANAGSIRPGNSGGPFTDDRFRVAGVAQRGAYMGTGHDECLCFEIADALIAAWKATLVPPAPPPAPAAVVPPPAPPPIAPAGHAPTAPPTPPTTP